MNSSQTLYEVLFAVTVVVGMAVALTLLRVAAGALFEREKIRAAGSSGNIPAQQPGHEDNARELVLR